MYGGYINYLVDFSWNKNIFWFVCSVVEDNLLQIWQLIKSIILLLNQEMEMNEMGSVDGIFIFQEGGFKKGIKRKYGEFGGVKVKQEESDQSIVFRYKRNNQSVFQ